MLAPWTIAHCQTTFCRADAPLLSQRCLFLQFTSNSLASTYCNSLASTSPAWSVRLSFKKIPTFQHALSGRGNAHCCCALKKKCERLWRPLPQIKKRHEEPWPVHWSKGPTINGEKYGYIGMSCCIYQIGICRVDSRGHCIFQKEHVEKWRSF